MAVRMARPVFAVAVTMAVVMMVSRPVMSCTCPAGAVTVVQRRHSNSSPVKHFAESCFVLEVLVVTH